MVGVGFFVVIFFNVDIEGVYLVIVKFFKGWMGCVVDYCSYLNYFVFND